MAAKLSYLYERVRVRDDDAALTLPGRLTDRPPIFPLRLEFHVNDGFPPAAPEAGREGYIGLVAVAVVG